MTCIFSYNKKQKQSPRGACKKGVLRNFSKFTGKHLRQSLCDRPQATFMKKETLAQVFFCEFCEISERAFPYRTPPVSASEQNLRFCPYIGKFIEKFASNHNLSCNKTSNKSINCRVIITNPRFDNTVIM